MFVYITATSFPLSCVGYSCSYIFWKTCYPFSILSFAILTETRCLAKTPTSQTPFGRWRILGKLLLSWFMLQPFLLLAEMWRQCLQVQQPQGDRPWGDKCISDNKDNGVGGEHLSPRHHCWKSILLWLPASESIRGEKTNPFLFKLLLIRLFLTCKWKHS